MSLEQQKKYAKAVMLGQRIYLNNQAMINQLSRTSFNLNNSTLKQKFLDALKDLSICLNNFEEITKIDLSNAKKTLTDCNEALKNNDTTQLYNNIQKLFRNDYLAQILKIAGN